MGNKSVQAFPRPYSSGGCGVEGMTLRDWFAGKAVQGLLAGLGRGTGVDLSVLVHEAFRVADEMMARRSVRGGER